MNSIFQVLPRTIQRDTSLVNAVILYPGADPAYFALSEILAGEIERICGVRPELQADTDVMPSRTTLLPDRYRQRSLILLGNLGTNRVLLPLYARYYCATDVTYPGGDGYDLRTIVNPYGTGTNVILAGGSSFEGVRRAVDCLTHSVSTSSGSLPFLLDVELAPELAQSLAQWPDAPLNAPLEDGLRQTHQFSEDLMKVIGAYGIMYAWTGDRRYGHLACHALKTVNAQMTDSYGDWHYRAERMLRVLPWLIAGGFLSDFDILRTDQLLLGTALGTQNMWWRMREGHPILGHRHQGRGTFEFLLLAHYLKEQAHPNDMLRAQCDRWIAESQAYLDALGRAGIDDQDDESTLTNLATVFWYAFGEERFDFFESGSARRIAQRAVALHDNMGAGAGQGGYGEGFPGTLVLQQEATVPVAASAFYYQDGGLQWLLEHMPHLKAPLISGFLHFSPLFMHMFHCELSASRPDDMIGLRVLPITPHQYAISTHPPEHIEYAGHSVNARETWRRGEGISLNTLRLEQGFDKIVLRGGFAPTDLYLLLQGYQGGFRWQGHMQAANCIVRFSQAGHIFLTQNTNRHSHYQKNGLFISDGYNNTSIPPIAEQIACSDFPRVALTATRLSDFHHTVWTRHIIWSKADDVFIVVDSVAFQQDGDYSLICTWRTPGYASLDGRCWQARQGEHQFVLCWSEPFDVSSEEETDQGGAVPYVLRQHKGGQFEIGDQISFQNLFYVRKSPEALDLHQLDSGQTLLTRSGQAFAWCGIADLNGEIHALGLTLHAVIAWVSHHEIAVCGLTHLSFPAGQINSDQPISFSLDLSTRIISGAEITLPDEVIDQLASTLRTNFSKLQPTKNSTQPMHPSIANDWSTTWSFNDWTLVSRRIRDLIVTSEPKSLDGFPQQLIDGVVAEIRQTRQQWPVADHYAITLTLPEETAINHLRIVGDSQIEPTLRTFHPLPTAITVEVSSSQGTHVYPVNPDSGVLSYKLFRDIEDRLETRTVQISAPASQIHIRIEAPADNNPLVLHEIEVYGCEQVAPAVQFLLVADLSGDGQQSILIANAANELIVLSEQGEERWRILLPALITHLSTHDLGGKGRQSICVGLLGGELRIFDTDGVLESTLPLSQMFQQRGDAYFGRLYTIHMVQIWQRATDGRGALVVGGYSAICFLDPDFNIIGHSWADGSWQSDILVTPDTGDLWVRSGWNHGICLYEGQSGFSPSSENITFGGFSQSMFRGIRKVIPFVNGTTIAYEWLHDHRSILAAAENGVGVLSVEQRDWLWMIEGGTPITACIHAEDEVIIAGPDSFIATFAQADGRPLRKMRFDAAVTALAALSKNRLVVATRRGLIMLDRDWNIERSYPHSVSRLIPITHDRFVIMREDGVLEMLICEENP